MGMTDEEIIQFIKDAKKKAEEAKAAKARVDACRALKEPPTREEIEMIRESMLNCLRHEMSDEELVEHFMEHNGISREVAVETIKKYPPNREGHVAPLDVVAQKDKYPALFEEYVGFSDRWKESLKGGSDQEQQKNTRRWPLDANGYCTKIMNADFVRTLEPFKEEELKELPFNS